MKVINFPKNYQCQHCTLQFTWKLPEVEYHSCSDILFPNNWKRGCLGRPNECLNNHICNTKTAPDLINCMLWLKNSYAS